MTTPEPLELLVIEDNPADAALLQEALAPLRGRVGLRLTTVADLPDGATLAAGRRFDAVLLDLTLPSTTGLGTIEAANKLWPTLPLIVMTGLADEDVAARAVHLGAQDYLPKGQADSATILRCIRYAIDRKRAQLDLERGRDDLERVVQERTRDLQVTVEQLQAEVQRRQQAEVELSRTNRDLRVISESNQAVVRSESEADLMRQVCRAIVEIGGYRMAWVGLAENDAARTVRPVASFGLEEAYLSHVRISWADDEFGRGPSGTAIRSGLPQVCRDFACDVRMSPWRKSAVRSGFRSSIALPLRVDGAMLGALTIYAAEPDAFDETQTRVLSELADDLAFGLNALRMRNELRESRDRLRALAGELTLAEQRERRRMAKVLHDHLQQLLVGAKFRAAILGRSDDEVVRQATGEIEELLAEAIQASRSLTAELSPPI
ncbi:MAG: GAF domain-containing protein, partial [Phycisphaerae bacterium]|nr:GAF domain-containing protein [Phycisphaerae bacterium]